MDKVQNAHNRREMFLDIRGKGRLIQMKLLYDIWNNKDYEELGFDSFRAYWEAPIISGGLDISRSWAMELVGVYKKYVIELGMPEKSLLNVSPRKLYFLKNKVDKDNVKDVVAQATSTTLKDLELEDKNINEATCRHTWSSWQRCEICGVWERC